MTVYILEQDPTIFITPTYYGNKFVYRMAYIRESNYRTLIRNIDLRKDKLRVHGSEIKENTFQRLHDSLTLGQKQGDIYVNCDGACYILVTGKGLCKPIYNVVFDWTPFGVVVPNSTTDSLKKELNQKDKEIDDLNRQLLSTMSSLKDKELELKNVIGKLSLVDFELESNKIELDLSKKAVLGLQDQLSTCKGKCDGLKIELQTLNDELILAVENLRLSNEKVIKLEEQLSSSNKEIEIKKTSLENTQEELSLIKIDSQSTKIELESSKKNVSEIENQLYSTMKYNENFIIQVKNLKEEISSINLELESTKSLLNRYEKEVQELENRHMSDKFRDISNDLNTINSEVRSSNRKIEEVLISMLWTEMSSEYEGDENVGYVLRNNRNVSDTANKLPILIKIEEIEDDIV